MSNVLIVESENDKFFIEAVIKKIKSKDSTIADCLESWQESLPENKKLKQKDFDKLENKKWKYYQQ